MWSSQSAENNIAALYAFHVRTMRCDERNVCHRMWWTMWTNTYVFVFRRTRVRLLHRWGQADACATPFRVQLELIRCLFAVLLAWRIVRFTQRAMLRTFCVESFTCGWVCECVAAEHRARRMSVELKKCCFGQVSMALGKYQNGSGELAYSTGSFSALLYRHFDVWNDAISTFRWNRLWRHFLCFDSAVQEDWFQIDRNTIFRTALELVDRKVKKLAAFRQSSGEKCWRYGNRLQRKPVKALQ